MFLKRFIKILKFKLKKQLNFLKIKLIYHTTKNDSIIPIKISDINFTRPLKSFFPNPNYIVKTKIDENLIVVED
jgi:hypothetical protein